ncbi:unnamed protein product [Lampetra planeri]
MRSNVHALTDWVTKNELLQCVGLKASDITGTSNQAGHMTQDEQRKVINNFSKGSIYLLISTTVTEEGLDIKLCNFVIHHELVTTEIAMLQMEEEKKLAKQNENLPETVLMLCKNCDQPLCRGQPH